MRRYAELFDETPGPSAGAPAALDVENPASQALLDDIGRRMLKRRVDALKSLPTFPESVARVNQALGGDGETDAPFARIAAVIETDPVLVARILRLVNSAFYGQAGLVVTVYDALVMLGLDVVRGLVLSTHALDTLGLRRGMAGLWEHSYGAAVAAASLGRVLGISRVEELSAAALMHDLGKVVLATQLPEDYAAVVAHAAEAGIGIREAESALLGVTHDEIGRWLVTRWRLPPALAEPVARHHTPESAGEHADATAVVHVADLMVRAYGFGFAGDDRMPVTSESAWRRLGLTPAKVRAAVAGMHHALHLALASGDLYPDR